MFVEHLIIIVCTRITAHLNGSRMRIDGDSADRVHSITLKKTHLEFICTATVCVRWICAAEPQRVAINSHTRDDRAEGEDGGKLISHNFRSTDFAHCTNNEHLMEHRKARNR